MTLKQALKERRVTHAELARRIHRSTRMVYRYVDEGWPIPPDVARNISFATGIKLDVILDDGKAAV